MLMLTRAKNTISLHFKLATVGLTLPVTLSWEITSNYIIAGNGRERFMIAVKLVSIFLLLLSALLRDCSLCWDRWRGTWLLHLTRPCFYSGYSFPKRDSIHRERSGNCVSTLSSLYPLSHHGWICQQLLVHILRLILNQFACTICAHFYLICILN